MGLHERLEELFREVFNDDALVLSDETTPVEVPGWDSFAHINLMCSIEERFGIQFTGNELAEMNNIGELKKCIAAKGCQ